MNILETMFNLVFGHLKAQASDLSSGCSAPKNGSYQETKLSCLQNCCWHFQQASARDESQNRWTHKLRDLNTLQKTHSAPAR